MIRSSEELSQIRCRGGWRGQEGVDGFQLVELGG